MPQFLSIQSTGSLFPHPLRVQIEIIIMSISATHIFDRPAGSDQFSLALNQYGYRPRICRGERIKTVRGCSTLEHVWLELSFTILTHARRIWLCRSSTGKEIPNVLISEISREKSKECRKLARAPDDRARRKKSMTRKMRKTLTGAERRSVLKPTETAALRGRGRSRRDGHQESSEALRASARASP